MGAPAATGSPKPNHLCRGRGGTCAELATGCICCDRASIERQAGRSNAVPATGCICCDRGTKPEGPGALHVTSVAVGGALIREEGSRRDPSLKTLTSGALAKDTVQARPVQCSLHRLFRHDLKKGAGLEKRLEAPAAVSMPLSPTASGAPSSTPM